MLSRARAGALEGTEAGRGWSEEALDEVRLGAAEEHDSPIITVRQANLQSKVRRCWQEIDVLVFPGNNERSSAVRAAE